jgi:hypothetical protein
MGALVADTLTSVIQTAVTNNVNPFDYLVALQKNKSQVHKNPANWLPWNYKNNLQSEKTTSPLKSIV